MTSKTAKCHCGQLSLTCEGEPITVVMCHCRHCQRRTGSAFNLAAWYPADKVTVQGETKVYQRTGDRGIEMDFRFCPTCGTNVYWTMAPRQGAIGVAIGCFADPGFAKPDKVLYSESRHHWVHNPEGVPSFDQQSPR